MRGTTAADTVYLDPPYTKRQYAAYYHILETISLGDEPIVEGICGIRPEVAGLRREGAVVEIRVIAATAIS